MANLAQKRDFRRLGDHVLIEHDLPHEVVQARIIEWGVIVDAYLSDAARVGQRYAAIVFCDLSGLSENGVTVVTPPLLLLKAVAGYKLMRSVSGADHFVITSEKGA